VHFPALVDRLPSLPLVAATRSGTLAVATGWSNPVLLAHDAPF